MPRKLNVNEIYTSNTFSDYTSTLREVLEEDNLPLSKTSLHGVTMDTFLVSIVYWEEAIDFTSNGQQEVEFIGDFQVFWTNAWGHDTYHKAWVQISYYIVYLHWSKI